MTPCVHCVYYISINLFIHSVLSGKTFSSFWGVGVHSRLFGLFRQRRKIAKNREKWYNLVMTKQKKSQIEIANELRFEAEKGFSLEDVKKAKKNIVRLAENADTHTVQLSACKDIVDRVEGKATQHLEHTGEDGQPININIIKYKK